MTSYIRGGSNIRPDPLLLAGLTGDGMNEMDAVAALQREVEDMRSELAERGIAADGSLADLGLELRVKRTGRGHAVASVWRISPQRRLSNWFRA